MRRLRLLLLLLAAAGAAALAVLASPAARADVVTLTTGARLEGTVVYEDAEVVKIETRVGVQTVYREDIVKIEKIADPKVEFARRRKALEADRGARAQAWYDLGTWAADHKLEAEAKAAFEKAIALDPDHAGARNRLGYERVRREWLTHAEAQRRKGLVEYEGRWVKPEEKEKLEQGYVLDIDGQWVKKEVIEARKAAEEERARRLREGERERARQARERAQAEAERKGEAAGASGAAGEKGGAGEKPEAGAIDVAGGREGEPPSAYQLERMLENQKSLARGAEQVLGVKFEDVEEGPLLVHTTHPKDSPKLRDFLKNLGKIYQAETRIYNLPFEAPIWPGKLQIYFFKDKEQFDAFATRIDDAPGAVQSGGYFIHGGSPGGYPKLHIAMYNLELGTLAHEVSHAFTSRYQYSERVVAPWVNEGVAEFLRIHIAETLELGQRDFRHRGLVKEMLIRNDPRVSLPPLMAKEDIQGTEGWAYAVSYSAIDFMISADKSKFVKFLKALKRGDGSFRDRWRGADAAEQRRAIEESFGTTLENFEASWKDFVRAYK